MQTLASEPEYMPAAHGDAAASPVAAQAKPTRQAEQDVDPVVACSVPTAHAVHAIAPEAEYKPAAHAPETTESPVAEQYEPEGQAAQELVPGAG